MRWVDAEGRDRSESSKTDDWHEANRRLSQKIGKTASGEVVPEGGRKACTFDDGVAAIEADYSMNNRRSWYTVSRRIVTLRDFFGGDTKMLDIRTPNLAAYRVKRKAAGVNDGSINNELAVLRRMFTLSRKLDMLVAQPYFPMANRKSAAREGFFEAADAAAIESRLPERFRAAAVFARITGWRFASEVLGLKWSEVDRVGFVVSLYKSKNGKGRAVPYGGYRELLDVINAQWAFHEALALRGIISPLVFPEENGGAMVYFHHERAMLKKIWRDAWHAAAKDAGVSGRIPHDYRRTAVRNLIRAGVPEKIAMATSGHESRTVFEHYNIVNPADVAIALDRLAQHNGQQVGESDDDTLATLALLSRALGVDRARLETPAAQAALAALGRVLQKAA
jgi:integrase